MKKRYLIIEEESCEKCNGRGHFDLPVPEEHDMAKAYSVCPTCIGEGRFRREIDLKDALEKLGLAPAVCH